MSKGQVRFSVSLFNFDFFSDSFSFVKKFSSFSDEFFFQLISARVPSEQRRMWKLCVVKDFNEERKKVIKFSDCSTANRCWRLEDTQLQLSYPPQHSPAWWKLENFLYNSFALRWALEYSSLALLIFDCCELKVSVQIGHIVDAGKFLFSCNNHAAFDNVATGKLNFCAISPKMRIFSRNFHSHESLLKLENSLSGAGKARKH